MASYKRRKDEEREFWKEFISTYRRLPELWNVNSNGYMDKKKREASYKILVDKMKEYDRHADKQSVRAKISSLRSTYRRELSKVKSAVAAGEEYVPSLWYFEDMNFLKNQTCPGTRHSAMRHNDTEFSEENNESEVDEASSQASQYVPSSWQHAPSNQPTINDSSNESEESKRAKLLSLACKRLTNPPSETELLVKSWLVDYEKLNPDQQLYAKKFINDVLFEGQLGNLHRNAITVNSAPQPIGSSHPSQWAHPLQGYNPGPSNENRPDPAPSPHSNISIHCDSSRATRQVEQMDNSTLGSLEDPIKDEQLD